MTEDQTTEWKASWRDDHLKSICGFANAQGGVLEVGRDDAGNVVGLKNADRLAEELPNKIRSMLGIMASVESLSENSLPYLRIEVSPYWAPISYRGRYYCRSGSTTQLLNDAALNEFLLRKYGVRWDSAPVPNVEVAELDRERLLWFRQQAVSAKRLDSTVFAESDAELVRKLRLMEGEHLKRAAVLLFHPDPESIVTRSSIKIGYFETDSDLRYHDEIGGDLFAQVDRTMDLLLTKYQKAVISYEGISRVETFPVPVAALREAVLNAVIHRDYSTTAQILIRVQSHRIQIVNSGRLPDGWSLDTFVGKHESRPPNPDVANAFYRAGHIEARGRGIQRIFDACRKAGTPRPEITADSGSLWIEFQFSDEYLSALQPGWETRTGLKSGTATTREKVLELMREEPAITQKELASRIGITADGVSYHIRILKDAGRISRIGPTKKGYWKVRDDGDSAN